MYAEAIALIGGDKIWQPVELRGVCVYSIGDMYSISCMAVVNPGGGGGCSHTKQGVHVALLRVRGFWFTVLSTTVVAQNVQLEYYSSCSCATEDQAHRVYALPARYRGSEVHQSDRAYKGDWKV